MNPESDLKNIKPLFFTNFLKTLFFAVEQCVCVVVSVHAGISVTVQRCCDMPIII
jgi:hypothetical protein